MAQGKIMIRTLTLLLILTLFAGVSGTMPAQAAGAVQLTHIHGMSYSADGARLLIPSHHGLAIFENGKWRKADGPAHDFMGFSATRNAMYSSGHPAPDSGLVNPFGLIKSTDGGKSWNKLGLEGESDFHTLSTGYANNAVYVVNHAVNSRMNQPGIHVTRNDGLQWTRADGKGLAGEIKSLAVHPEQPDVVAAGTASGLYLSRNAGGNFTRLADGFQVLATTFDLDGKSLWFSTYDGKAGLMRIGLGAGARAQALRIPVQQEDAIAYIAQNPMQRQEIAVATFKRQVFISPDSGRSWKLIARNGDTLE
ncbi:MAG: glycosyl hydrolase [Rhodoferax sp.]|nr:glycosyl hydrolase [Rhodoferax sp.]